MHMCSENVIKKIIYVIKQNLTVDNNNPYTIATVYSNPSGLVTNFTCFDHFSFFF